MPPSHGGYRSIDTETRTRIKARILERIEARFGDSGIISVETFNALGAAIHDVTPELRRCMEVDPISADLQYVVHLDIIGTRMLATIVDAVKVWRIAELAGDGTPTLVATAAEACFVNTLMKLELPPGGGPSSMETVIRFQDCGPEVKR